MSRCRPTTRSTRRFFLLSIFVLLAPTAVRGLASTSSAKGLQPNVFQRLQLKLGGGKKLREQVVARYFDGVNQQSKEQIAGCFAPEGTTIRDVCGASPSERLATPDQLGDRCMEFLAAHPDTKVLFHYPPTCGRGRSNRWVVAHWYEEGTWKAESQGIPPQFTPLTVEGQTRFLVNDNLKITKMIVTRTFSEWENLLQARNASKE